MVFEAPLLKVLNDLLVASVFLTLAAFNSYSILLLGKSFNYLNIEKLTPMLCHYLL